MAQRGYLPSYAQQTCLKGGFSLSPYSLELPEVTWGAEQISTTAQPLISCPHAGESDIPQRVDGDRTCCAPHTPCVGFYLCDALEISLSPFASIPFIALAIDNLPAIVILGRISCNTITDRNICRSGSARSGEEKFLLAGKDVINQWC